MPETTQSASNALRNKVLKVKSKKGGDKVPVDRLVIGQYTAPLVEGTVDTENLSNEELEAIYADGSGYPVENQLVALNRRMVNLFNDGFGLGHGPNMTEAFSRVAIEALVDGKKIVITLAEGLTVE